MEQKPTIAVVVPTLESRKDIYELFLSKWNPLFDKHDVTLIKVVDDVDPMVYTDNGVYTMEAIMGGRDDLIFNKNDGVRNLGFAWIAKYSNADVIITLDDDVLPYGDTIADHLNVLKRKAPLGRWINTLQNIYPRGVPYKIREEAKVMVSHGLWNTNLDLDAPNQLIFGSGVVSPYNRFFVPRGCLIAFCGMNVAFNREVLPYMYYAPMGERIGLDRFADIFLGIVLKDIMDEKEWVMATGFAEVIHNRASNVFKNLQKEAKGIEMNETFYEEYGTSDDAYLRFYREKYADWQDFIIKNDHLNSVIS